MGIPLRTGHNPLRLHHVRTWLRPRLAVILLTVGALLMFAGFTSDGQLGRGAFASAPRIDFSSWLLFSGLVVIASGALVALRGSHPE